MSTDRLVFFLFILILFYIQSKGFIASIHLERIGVSFMLYELYIVQRRILMKI